MSKKLHNCMAGAHLHGKGGGVNIPAPKSNHETRYKSEHKIMIFHSFWIILLWPRAKNFRFFFLILLNARKLNRPYAL